MKMNRIVAPSLTDLFVNEMKRLILSGEMQPGEQLAPERQLAKETGVSLAVVHAGIGRLQTLGFLSIVPRQGVFVTDYIREGNINTMKEVIEFSGDRMSSDVLLPIAACRRGIETAAVKLACVKHKEEDIKKLSALVERAHDVDQFQDFPQIAFAFHHEIALAGGNPYYPMLIRTFESMYLLFFRELVSYSEQKEEADRLGFILEAVKKQDTQEAVRLIHEAVDAFELKSGARKR